LGAAIRGEWKPALQLCRNQADSPQDRLAALSALAGLAVESPGGLESSGLNLDQMLSTLLEEARPLVEAEPKDKKLSPWLLYDLVQNGARSGAGDKVQPLLDALSDLPLRGRGQLALLRARLENTRDQADADWANSVDANAPVRGLAIEAIARHNGRLGGAAADSAQASVDGQASEALRPFGYIGLALGLQDHDQH
jgi:hypothetical protein